MDECPAFEARPFSISSSVFLSDYGVTYDDGWQLGQGRRLGCSPPLGGPC